MTYKTRFSLARLAALSAVMLFSAASSFAQMGDRKDAPGTVQEAPWNDLDIPPAPVLSPEDALATLTVPKGFKIELVATEPLVNDPVTIAWDAQGRIWAAEMWAYMPDVDGAGEEGPPRGRVVVMEDVDNDGVMDRSTVFLDQLNMPRAIAFVEGGVLIGDPPNLLYCQDKDGDLRADTTEIVGPYAAQGSIEHTENGLMHAMDNWIYNAKSDRRFKFAAGKLTEEKTFFRGQWGITMDDIGRLFYNNNSNWLHGDYYPWEYVSNNPGYEPRAGLGQNLTQDMRVFTHRINPGVNRGYIDGVLREDFRLARITAACGPTIYRGDQFSREFAGNAFIPEPAGNVVARFRLLDQGVEVFGQHRLEPHAKWKRVEFLGSTDERFRPIQATNGPDGNLYIVDMYRGILQHKIFVTTFLRKQILKRGLDKPVGYGRIYRIRPDGDPKPAAQPNLKSASNRELAAHLNHANGWWRDTAQRLLVERQPRDPSSLSAIRSVVKAGTDAGKLHALWTLHGVNAITPEIIETALVDRSDSVRVHALRVAPQILKDLSKLSVSKLQNYIDQGIADRSPRVRLQAYQSLKHVSDSEFVIRRFVGAANLEWTSPHFQETAVSVLSGQERAFFTALRNETGLSIPDGLLATAGKLTGALFAKRNTEALQGVFASIKNPANLRPLDTALLSGIANGAERKGAKPISLESLPKLFEQLRASEDSSAQQLEQRLRAAFVKAGETKKSSARDRLTEEELAFAKRGAQLYGQTCFACHGANGRGQAGVAPSLDASPWVLGSKERLALIVAHGLTGPIEVNGEQWNGVMPGNAVNPLLSGDNLAAVLSYIRTAWSNEAGIVRPEEVAAALAPHAGRTELWTPEELENLFGPVKAD